MYTYRERRDRAGETSAETEGRRLGPVLATGCREACPRRSSERFQGPGGLSRRPVRRWSEVSPATTALCASHPRSSPPQTAEHNTKVSRSFRQRKLRQDQNVTRDSNPDFRINPYPDPDVCRIAPKKYWIHALVGASHFAKSRKNRLVTV